MSGHENSIPYDRMKEQIEKNILPYIENSKLKDEIPFPVISFEKGTTQISFALPTIAEPTLFTFVTLIKNHIANIRIHSFEEGYIAFQALNKNMFNTENLLDNLKIEFFTLSSSSRIALTKKGNLIQEEISLAIELYKKTFTSLKDDPVVRLRRLGASVISATEDLTWDYIAGYEEVKRSIRESIILPLKNPEIYDSIAMMTRKVFESNRPRAILFDGQPGVGKTTAAKIIASDVSIPLIYVPIESIMSKWYGQSSQNLSQIFDACEDLGGGILFLDEIDSLVGSRDQNMFEATRRILSVLLRRLDGIDSAMSTITIGATNRKNDLDHALISRFDQTIYFPLPNAAERAAIFGNYARHLPEEECRAVGEKSDGLSGRNIKDICELVERRWVRKLLIKKLDPSPPPVEYYKHALRNWMNNE